MNVSAILTERRANFASINLSRSFELFGRRHGACLDDSNQCDLPFGLRGAIIGQSFIELLLQLETRGVSLFGGRIFGHDHKKQYKTQNPIPSVVQQS